MICDFKPLYIEPSRSFIENTNLFIVQIIHRKWKHLRKKMNMLLQKLIFSSTFFLTLYLNFT